MTDYAAALEFCAMVKEIGMSDDTIIPVWPNDTEMALTHPLTVGMIKTITRAIQIAQAVEEDVQAGMVMIKEDHWDYQRELFEKIWSLNAEKDKTGVHKTAIDAMTWREGLATLPQSQTARVLEGGGDEI